MSKLFCIFLLSMVSFDLNDIAKINSLKKQAEEAFTAGKYEDALQHYSFLLDTMGIVDESATMNYAHTQYKTGNIELAQGQYQKLVLSQNSSIKSLAYQQLGVISNDPKTLERALSYFKESIKSDPTNDDARYNYELIKKKLNEQQEKEENNEKQDQKDQEKQDDQNKDKEDQKQQDQQKQDQDKQDKSDQDKEDQKQKDGEDQESKEQEQKEKEQEQEQKDGEEKEGEQKEKPEPKPSEEGKEEDKEGEDKQSPKPSTADKLEEMNISEEKAKMILEALKNSEIQYIQQNRRKPTKKQDSGKPDW